MKCVTLVLGLCFFGSLNAQRIVANSYKKSVFFTGAVVREEHLIDLQVADEPPKPGKNLPIELIEEIHQNWFPNYVFVVPKDEAEQLASWEARMISDPSNPETNPLAISEITSEVASCHANGFRCLNVVLPMDGQLNKNFIIAISVAFVGQIRAKPEVQGDISVPARLFYRSESLEPLSVYEIGATQTILALTAKSKSLKLKCPVGRKPEKLTGANLPMGMKGFVCNGQGSGPVEFRFELREALMARLKNLHRKFTFLPWTGEVKVTESFEYVHEGPKQPESPSFSRIEFAKTLQRTRGNLEGLQVIPQVLVVVPHSARSITVRDEVGIIWSEKERNGIDAESEVVAVPLRFPLLGGMTAAFDFEYTMDAADLIRPYQASSSPFKKLIHIPMFRSPLDIPVDNFKLTFVLPEDTADIEYELATSKPVRVNRREYRTYFSTTREKEISFEFEKMTREDLEKAIAVLFNFPFWGTARKPLVALSTLVFLVIGVLYLNRLDLSLKEERKVKGKGGKQTNMSNDLKELFQKRREILMNYEDLIAGNMNTRPTSEQLKSDTKLRAQLDDQLTQIQNAIFEKIKNNVGGGDAQKSAMNSMALKRLYDDQAAVCKKILAEVCESFCGSADSLGNSDFSSKSMSMSSMGRKMSQSGSGDLMNTAGRAGSKAVENYAAEAVKIDAQVGEYEAKFFCA